MATSIREELGDILGGLIRDTCDPSLASIEDRKALEDVVHLIMLEAEL